MAVPLSCDWKRRWNA